MKSILSKLPLFILLLIVSCNKDDQEKDTFSSPTSLFVNLISSYTSGIVSSSAEIKVRLAKKVAEAFPGEKLKREVLDFEPSIDGFAYWEDAYTLVFKPEQKLEGGEKYKVKLQLNSLLETPKDKEEFRFVFHVMPQNFEVKVEEMSFYDMHNLKRVKVGGSVQTADVADNLAIEKMLTASQNGEALKVSWDHGPGRNLHRFTIEDIARTAKEGKVEISWTGDPLEVEK